MHEVIHCLGNLERNALVVSIDFFSQSNKYFIPDNAYLALYEVVSLSGELHIFRHLILLLFAIAHSDGRSNIERYFAVLPVDETSFRDYVIEVSGNDIDIAPLGNEFNVSLPLDSGTLREITSAIVSWILTNVPSVDYVYVDDKHVLVIHEDNVLTAFDRGKNYRKIGSVVFDVDWDKLDFVDSEHYEVFRRGTNKYEVTLSFSQNCPAGCDGCEQIDLKYRYLIAIDNGIKILDKDEEYKVETCEYDDEE